MRLQRNKPFRCSDLRPAARAHHQRNAWPVDIAVQQPDLVPQMLQRAGEVDRQRRFADAALAAGHGNDLLDAVGALRTLPLRAASWSPPGSSGRPRPGRRLFDLHVGHAHIRQTADDGLGLLLDRRAFLRIVRGHLNDHAHGAIAAGNVLDHSKRNDIPRIPGKLHGLQGFFDRVLSQHKLNKLCKRGANVWFTPRNRKRHPQETAKKGQKAFDQSPRQTDCDRAFAAPTNVDGECAMSGQRNEKE